MGRKKRKPDRTTERYQKRNSQNGKPVRPLHRRTEERIETPCRRCRSFSQQLHPEKTTELKNIIKPNLLKAPHLLRGFFYLHQSNQKSRMEVVLRHENEITRNSADRNIRLKRK